MSVKVQPNGRVLLQFKYRDPSAPRTRRTFSRAFDLSVDEAKALEPDLMRAARDGRLGELLALVGRGPTSRSSFAAVARDFVEIHAASLAKEGGGMRRDARSAVEVHLIPHFGDRPVSSITLRDLEGFRAALRSVDGRRGRPVSAKTVYNIEVVLRAVLRWALATGRIQANPADRLPALTRRQRQAPGFENFYLPDQMMLALDALEGHERRMREDKAALPRFRLPWRLILGFLFETGLRVGELAALTKFDVRLAEREVRVSKAVFLGKLQTTKGVNERTVPISPDTAARLERHVARLDPENPLLFPNSDGRYLTSNSFHAPLRWISENVVERTVVAAGVRRELKLKRVSPHAFRHSCGTMLAMADTGEEKIRRHLGHASTSMVQRYVHLAARPDPALNRRLVALIDEARERLRAKARAQGEGNG